MNDDENFTNRRGHTMSAVQKAANTLPDPEHAAPKPTPVRRKRRKFRLSRLQKRVIVIILAVVILVPVAVGEYVRSAYNSDVSSAKNIVAKILAAGKNQPDAMTSTSLKAIDAQLSSIRDGLCPGGFLDNLAKLYPRALAAYNSCAAYRSSVAALENHVTSAAEQMAYLEQLQPLLESVSKPLEDQFAVLSAQQENWQTFVDGLNDLSVPASFSSAHAGLLAEATGIRDQWIALVQASTAFDSSAFRTARTLLTEHFTAFRAQTAQFSAAVIATQAAIINAASALK